MAFPLSGSRARKWPTSSPSCTLSITRASAADPQRVDRSSPAAVPPATRWGAAALLGRTCVRLGGWTIRSRCSPRCGTTRPGWNSRHSAPVSRGPDWRREMVPTSQPSSSRSGLWPPRSRPSRFAEDLFICLTGSTPFLRAAGVRRLRYNEQYCPARLTTMARRRETRKAFAHACTGRPRGLVP